MLDKFIGAWKLNNCKLVNPELLRKFEFKDNNTLILSTLELLPLADGTQVYRHLTWIRVTKPVKLNDF